VLEQLTWYARRLHAMSPREVAERSRRTVAHRIDAAMFRIARQAWTARWEPSAQALLRTASPGAARGFLRRERASELWARLPTEADALVEHAENMIEGTFRVFGYPDVCVDDTRQHDLDPLTGRQWPPHHAKRIDYRRRAPGDPKWIWELNRCQDLPVLAAAWLLSGRTRYGEAAAKRLLSWIDSHPPGRGIAWSSGFEAGIRAISLATTIDALRGSDLLSPAQQATALRALWQHARWIERDPSTGSSANNHRIGEVVGLVVIGSLLPELKDAQRWVETGVGALSREAERQIRSDGTSVEQSFSYHVFVVDLLLVATAALDCAGEPVPPSVTAAIERSGDALWAQLGADEPVPTYGDTDDGRAIVLDGRDLRDPRGTAAAVAARFGHAGCARAARGLDATAWWLFGANGADRLARVEPAPEPGSLLLPDGGLAVLRSGRRRAVLDYGPHGHLSIAAHAHADALRLDVSLADAELVVDPGVGSYFAQPRFREAFRGTGFHATVVVDGVSSSVPGGPFLWTRHAAARLLIADLAEGVVVAEHDGYRRLEDPVLHRRAVVAVGESILVVDRLQARGAHLYSQRWPLHPDLELDGPHVDRVVARQSGSGLLVALSASQPFALTAVRGRQNPLSGWWSERLESVAPSWLVATDVHAVGVLEIAALLVPFESESVPEARLELEVGDRGTRVEVLTPHGEESIELDLGSPVIEMRRVTSTMRAR
jgi:uncharacterized heparinase superfamily protein